MMENSIEDFLNGFQEDDPVYQIIQDVRNGVIPDITNATEAPTTDGEPLYSVRISGREPILVDTETKDRIVEAITLKRNSETLLINNTTSRFSGALWYEAIQKERVVLAGLGGIGRFGNLVNF